MADTARRPLDEHALRALVPRALARLVRRGEDFDAAARAADVGERDHLAREAARARAAAGTDAPHASTVPRGGADRIAATGAPDGLHAAARPTATASPITTAGPTVTAEASDAPDPGDELHTTTDGTPRPRPTTPGGDR